MFSPGPSSTWDAEDRGLFAQRFADFLAERRVPGVGHGGGGGKAGSRQRSVETQVIRGARLLAQAVRPIGEEERRDAAMRESPCFKHGLAAQQRRLLPQGHIREYVCVLHSRSRLPTV